MLGANLSNICYEHRVQNCKTCFAPIAQISIASPDEKIINLQVRIADLEFHKNMQIDENRKMSRRIDELETHISGVNGVLERLNILFFHKNRLSSRVDELECGKKPHKCPVCDGEGIKKRQSISPTPPYVLHETEDCKCCDGKGIVWGKYGYSN